jgi:integrase
MAETDSAPAPVTERLTVEEVGKRRIRDLARRGRKQDTTLANYESEIRCHFVPHFAQSPIAEIGEDEIADFIDACLNDLSVKTVRNLYVHLNAIFEFAIRKRWGHANPCKLVDKPASVADDDTEMRFLDQAELDALLAVPAPRCHSKRTLERAARARALRDQERQWKEIGETLGCSPATAIYLYRATAEVAADEDLWRVDLAMYLTAVMTGLRQGEVLALRWRDVDWSARKLRVSGGMRNGKRRTPPATGQHAGARRARRECHRRVPAAATLSDSSDVAYAVIAGSALWTAQPKGASASIASVPTEITPCGLSSHRLAGIENARAVLRRPSRRAGLDSCRLRSAPSARGGRQGVPGGCAPGPHPGFALPPPTQLFSPGG